MTKEFIITLFIGDMINKAVREKRGRLTEVSDLCVINRQKFDPDGIAHLDFYQLVRLGRAIENSIPKDRLLQLKSDIKDIWDSFDDMEDDVEPAEL